MKQNKKKLEFRELDELVFAAMRGKLDRVRESTSFVSEKIGPLLELVHLSTKDQILHPRSWLDLDSAAPLVSALEDSRETWLCPQSGDTGFIRALRHGDDADSRFTGFLMAAKRAGREIAGLPSAISGQLVAAMEELENNIHEHARAPETGVVAFKAKPGSFEFVVADRGIGILHSLQECQAYKELRDDGTALAAALTDGVSRRGPSSSHGHGFRPIFTGLVNLRGELRFRSGNHALMMDGTSPDLATARIVQKAPIDGFFASITCHCESSSMK